MSAIDLFCGAGGLAYGLQDAGLDVKAGFDIDPDCKYPFETNNSAEFHMKDIRSVTGDDLNQLWGDGSQSFRLLAGCAPCQPFSTLRQSVKNTDNDKWNLLREFGRLVDETDPHFVTMENVPGLAKTEIFSKFVSSMERKGYNVDANLVFLPALGLPQRRKRLVLVASRIKAIHVPVPKLKADEYKTVRDFIGEIEPLKHGEHSASDSLHRAQQLREINLQRIQSSKPGGTWRDWPVDLQLACHKKPTGKYYASVYGRMDWDSPSPTITTQFYNYGTGRFGHPQQDRAISLREGSVLQGFPPNYQFVPPGAPVIIDKIGRLIGNAVPPILGKEIGLAIMNSL